MLNALLKMALFIQFFAEKRSKSPSDHAELTQKTLLNSQKFLALKSPKGLT